MSRVPIRGSSPVGTANSGLPWRKAKSRWGPAAGSWNSGAELRWNWFRLQLSLEVGGDELAVEASVLDEDLAGAHSGNDDSGEINSRHIALQRLRIDDRTLVGFAAQLDAKRAEKFEVGMISGQSEDVVVGQRDHSLRRFEHDVLQRDLADAGIEVGFHLSCLVAVLDVGLDPVPH